ncbi:hypothetical protein PAE9249_03056 [Paenibacillus sp. CECT 9249]|uniref:ArnT family glycosyltransferase n=1 Tax=Paenibacillus sp. CECT 9249 TaxID=2845385 RepID=UPI001E49B1A0|nr:glycosyltransferase family 39 protein [Paenibacillus sp. CECT 9249]CAH0120537.1 hypothetical protein PAE9249_03056 [Paenibacillus sp. CECT 9249]
MLGILTSAGKWKKPAVISLIILIFALASFLRIDFLVSVHHEVSHDTVHYDIMVRQLLEKGVYAYKSTEPNAQVTPGYPLFMAAIYKLADYQHNDPFPYIRGVQVAISLITLWMIYVIARKLGGQPAGLIAAFAGAIYPPFVWSNAAVLTETLATLFLVIYIYVQWIAFERKTWSFAMLSGAVLGLVVLIRPEFLVIVFALHAFYFFWKNEKLEAFRKLAFALIGMAIVLSPWVIRNAVTLHEVVVASTQVNPFLAGTYPDKNYEDGLVDNRGKTQMEIAKERLKVGFTEHTWTFTKWYTIGKMKSTYSRMYFGSGHKPLYPVIPVLPWNLFHRALVGFGLIALVAVLRKWRQPATLLAVIIIVMSLVRLAFVPEYRYNYTVMPLIVILDSVVGMAMLRWIYVRLRGQSSLTKARGQEG